MSENETPAAGKVGTPLDPAFFDCVNQYLELTNQHAQQHGLKRTSIAALYAAARFNAHVYLSVEGDAAAARSEFLDYMTTLYRRMLNEHLDGLGQERNIAVGESELAAEYAALQAAQEQPAATGSAG